MRRPHSLQGRLLALLLGLVACVWMAAAALTWFDVRDELDELLDGHLAQAAALLVVQQAGEVGDDEHGVDAPVLHRYAPKVAFQVFHDGRLTMRSANAPTAPMIDAGGRFDSGFATVQIDGTTWRVFGTRGAERDVLVFVGEQEQSRASILRAVMRSTLWPMALALPLLALVAWWAVHRGVAPLRRLGRLLADRAPQALHPVRLEGAPSEMLPMIAALNGLFERIGSLLESERRFTADAAHELRTPIAAIRAQAQVAAGESDDSRRSHALAATLQGCDRAARLVDQLLMLSRLEAGENPPVETLDLGELVRRIAAEVAPGAIDRSQSLEVEVGGDCRVAGDETLLAALVRNLADNCVRYSPPGARVRLSVGREGGRVVLAVHDSGPGMGESELRRLGERFFRVLGTDQSGSGLGWSIVRRIAAAHRADIRVGRSERLGGLAVEVSWPAAA